MKAETSNLHTYASCPGELTLSNQKLKQLRPDLYGILGLICKAKDKYCLGFTKIEKIKAHIYYGDSQPAVVISLKPLIVAAYSEDLDCILPLKFPNKFVKNYKLKEKSRLLTINIYTTKKITWLRATLPGGCPPSTIAAQELNFCVRNGNRCILFAIITT